jgi:hypothetical protein
LKTSLRLLVEVGPSVGSASTHVTIRDAANHTVYMAVVKGRAAITAPVSLRAGESEFTVHVDTADRAVPNEHRKLNLRAFSIAALR